MPTVGVCLSGCGFLDGTEIHEAVSTLIALDQAGARIVCCAPDMTQADVVDHAKKAPADGPARSVLTESARIARGEIRPLAAVAASELDAIIFPGGFGAAKNLCTFAADGVNCSVNHDVERLVTDMIELKRPIGAICIAPALIARIAGKLNLSPKLTIGNDKDTAAALEKMGAEHVECAVNDCVVDEKNKIVTTPAYMLGPGPAPVFEGIKKLVDKVLELA